MRYASARFLSTIVFLWFVLYKNTHLKFIFHVKYYSSHVNYDIPHVYHTWNAISHVKIRREYLSRVKCLKCTHAYTV